MCKKEDEEENKLPEELDCTVNFSESAPSGMFMNSPFTVIDGSVEKSSSDTTKYRFQLYGRTVPGDKCDLMNFDKPDSSIIFYVPMRLGIYNLGFGSDGYSVTFNQIVNGSTNAVVSICGAVEITSITSTTISLKIQANAQDGKENYLNGFFTANLCK